MKALITITLFTLVMALYVQSQTVSRDGTTDLLKITVEGGTQSFVDETYIHFREGATTAYDIEIDALKWYSIDPEATMIWTIASDESELAINNLPLNDLYTTLNTIPLHFVCGYGGGEYSLSFNSFETFDQTIEIWLEDLVTGEGWIMMTEENSLYTFTALPDGEEDRFRIHIQDRANITGYEELKPEKEQVKMYSNGEKIFIDTNEGFMLSNVRVYNLSGQLVQHNVNPLSACKNMVKIDGPSGYYIVQASVNNSIHSEKIFVKTF